MNGEAHYWAIAKPYPIPVSGVVILPLVVFALPETHQFLKLQQLVALDPAAAAEVREADEIKRTPPVFSAPWVPLKSVQEFSDLHVQSEFST